MFQRSVNLRLRSKQLLLKFHVMPSVENSSINSVLCFLSSARKSYSKKNITNTCLSIYNAENNDDAKETLFKFLSEVPTKRRGNNKSRSDITDMIEVFKKLDASNAMMPQFFCDAHGKMPPSSGFEFISELLLGLIMEASTVKE